MLTKNKENPVYQCCECFTCYVDKIDICTICASTEWIELNPLHSITKDIDISLFEDIEVLYSRKKLQTVEDGGKDIGTVYRDLVITSSDVKRKPEIHRNLIKSGWRTKSRGMWFFDKYLVPPITVID